MKFDYEQTDYTEYKNFKGGDGSLFAKMFNDEKVRIINGKLQPGSNIGMHTHEENCEIIYITSGKGKVLIDNTEETLKAGDCHYCPKGHAHSLINDSAEDLCFFAVVPEVK